MLEEVSRAIPVLGGLLELHQLLEKLLVELLFFVDLDCLITLLLHEVRHK